MVGYYELSDQERGLRFREAVESLNHLGSYVNAHDGVIALEKVEIEDDPLFPGVCLVAPNGARGVFEEPLSMIVYKIARDRADQVPQDFIGPSLTTADSFNF